MLWIRGAGRAFPVWSPALSFLSDTPSPLPSAVTTFPWSPAGLESSMPPIPQSSAQVPAGHTILGEASKELSPTAAQHGCQASFLPPHGSFITAISGRKHNGHHELQHGFDLSQSAVEGPEWVPLTREDCGTAFPGAPGSTLGPLPPSQSPTAPLAATSELMSTLAAKSICRFKSQTLPQEIKR